MILPMPTCLSPSTIYKSECTPCTSCLWSPAYHPGIPHAQWSCLCPPAYHPGEEKARRPGLIITWCWTKAVCTLSIILIQILFQILIQIWSKFWSKFATCNSGSPALARWFLDAIASPSSYPCQLVSELVYIYYYFTPPRHPSIPFHSLIAPRSAVSVFDVLFMNISDDLWPSSLGSSCTG